MILCQILIVAFLSILIFLVIGRCVMKRCEEHIFENALSEKNKIKRLLWFSTMFFSTFISQYQLILLIKLILILVHSDFLEAGERVENMN